MFGNLTCHTRQTHFLPSTMSAVFNVNHNAPKSTECLFLSQDRTEPGPPMPFLQSAHAVDETVALSVSLLVSRCWAFAAYARSLAVLANQYDIFPVIPHEARPSGLYTNTMSTTFSMLTSAMILFVCLLLSDRLWVESVFVSQNVWSNIFELLTLISDLLDNLWKFGIWKTVDGVRIPE